MNVSLVHYPIRYAGDTAGFERLDVISVGSSMKRKLENREYCASCAHITDQKKENKIKG